MYLSVLVYFTKDRSKSRAVQVSAVWVYTHGSRQWDSH